MNWPEGKLNSNLSTVVNKPEGLKYPSDKFYYTEWKFRTVAPSFFSMLIRGLMLNLPVKYLKVKYEDIKSNSLRIKTELIPDQFKQIPIDQSTPVGTKYSLSVTANANFKWVYGSDIKKADSNLGPERICNSNLMLFWIDSRSTLTLSAEVMENQFQSRIVNNNWLFEFDDIHPEKYLDKPKDLFYKVQEAGQAIGPCFITIPSNGICEIDDVFSRVRSTAHEYLDAWKKLLLDEFNKPTTSNIVQRGPSSQIGDQVIAFTMVLPDVHGHLTQAFRIFVDQYSAEKGKFNSIIATFDNSKQESALIVIFAGTVEDFAKSMLIGISEFKLAIEQFNTP